MIRLIESLIHKYSNRTQFIIWSWVAVILPSLGGGALLLFTHHKWQLFGAWFIGWCMGWPEGIMLAIKKWDEWMEYEEVIAVQESHHRHN